MKSSSLIPVERIEKAIYLIRGEKVMLDSDLAQLYGVTTKRLNEQVNRNHERFPEDFVFQLTVEEITALTSQIAGSNLRSQIATSRTHGGRRCRPYAFTEHGSIMAANVLNSERAVQASVQEFGPSYACASCSGQTRSWHANLKSWKANTITSSKPCSTRFDN